MILRVRKRIATCLLIAIVLLANAPPITHSLQRIGVVDAATWFCRHYLTGTALVIIAVLLWLLTDPRDGRAGAPTRCCRTCDHALGVGGRYCPHCGSRN